MDLKRSNNESSLVDTIAAISTPIGEGGIAVVRMSGPKAFEIADKCFLPAKKISSKPSEAPTFTLHYGWIIRNGKKIDEVLLAVMRRPHTYTREDMIEISCHGGYLPARLILETLIEAGARLAEPGEFTKRAFLNGRIDLAQAEAVVDLIRAKTELALQAAQNVLEGGLSFKINSIRETVLNVLAHIEASIDFPEEDITPDTQTALIEKLIIAKEQINALITHSKEGRILRHGLKVVLIGRPNAGKSSLLNRLLQHERAIVSPIPGTTRDTIEEMINLKGIPIVLIDTAGLRDTTDPVESEGIRRTHQVLQSADLVVHIIDRSQTLSPLDLHTINQWKHKPYIIVLNKSDLPHMIEPASLKESIPSVDIISTCCLNGEGIEELKDLIWKKSWDHPISLGPESLMINTRHEEALKRANNAIDKAIKMLSEHESLEFVALEVRSAAEALGEITGKTLTEDLLDRIFSQFCIGK